MADPSYSTQLAPGFYVDSEGRYHSGPVADLPVFRAPEGGISLDFDKAKDVFQSMADAIESMTDPKSRESLTLRRFGITHELLSMFKGIGEVAASIAKFIPYVGALVELARMFDLLPGSGDALSPAIRQEFEKLGRQIDAFEKKWMDTSLGELEERVLTSLNEAKSYIDKLEKYRDIPPNESEWDILDQSRQNLILNKSTATVSLNSVLHEEWWSARRTGASSIPPEKEGAPSTRPFPLFCPPANGADPTWADVVSIPEHDEVRFDHRAMVFMVPPLVQSYLLFLKTILPEYRSTGTFRYDLRRQAIALEKLTADMRLNLLRTHHLPSDFSYALYTKLNPLTGQHERPPRAKVTVGAWDHMTENWPPAGTVDFPTGLWDVLAGTRPYVDADLVAYNWPVPQDWVAHQETSLGMEWRLPDPDLCAKMANEEAQKRFAKLCAVSGYQQMVQTCSLLRHLYTAPEKSEVVDGRGRSTATPGKPTAVQISSRRIAPFEPLTLEVMRTPRANKVTYSIDTQSQHRLDEPINFRFWLRTLHAQAGEETSYASSYWTSRLPEPETEEGVEPFEDLMCTFAGSFDQELVAEGRSPRDRKNYSLPDVHLRAHRFDFWVPIPDEKGPQLGNLGDKEWKKKQNEFTAIGMGRPDSVNSLVSSRTLVINPSVYKGPRDFKDVIWDELDFPLQGQRRNRQESEVSISYEATWEGPVFEISMDIQPEHGNFDLYLVVEESVPSAYLERGKDAKPVPDNHRHTYFKIPVLGQVTHVPQSFIEQEAKHVSEATKFWKDLIHEYSPSKNVSPEDPISKFGAASLETEIGRVAIEQLFREHAAPTLEQAIQRFKNKHV